MPRTVRIDPTSGWHHVTNRGARRHDVFVDDADRGLFVRLVRDAAARHGVDVIAYCLMGNHYHLVLHCPKGGLSKAMQHLAANYTRAFNERHGFDGALFKERFRSELIDTDEYLLAATRYVHRNPLELGFDIVLYPWSSYAAYVGRRPRPRWLRPEVPLALVRGDDEYRCFVEADLPGDETEIARGTEVLPTTTRATRGSPSLTAVDGAVGQAAGVAATRLRSGGKGSTNLPRSVAVLLAVDHGGHDLRDVARHYGFSSTSGVRTAVSRARERARRDDRVAALVSRAAASLPGWDGV